MQLLTLSKKHCWKHIYLKKLAKKKRERNPKPTLHKQIMLCFYSKIKYLRQNADLSYLSHQRPLIYKRSACSFKHKSLCCFEILSTIFLWLIFLLWEFSFVRLAIFWNHLAGGGGCGKSLLKFYLDYFLSFNYDLKILGSHPNKF